MDLEPFDLDTALATIRPVPTNLQQVAHQWHEGLAWAQDGERHWTLWTTDHVPYWRGRVYYWGHCYHWAVNPEVLDYNFEQGEEVSLELAMVAVETALLRCWS